MVEAYCIKDKRKTPCVEPSGYKRDKRNRLQFYCTCAVFGIKKVRYVKENGQLGSRRKTGSGKKKKIQKVGGDVFDTVVGTAADALVHHAVPWIAKKSVEMGRYGLSEAMRNKNLPKKAVNYGINKMTPIIQKNYWKYIRPIINKSQT